MTLALIDGDIVIYKAACAVEKEHRWPDGVWTYQADENEGINYLTEKLQEIQDEIKATDTIICLSDTEKNFRKHIYPDYKGNRTERKPLLFNFLRNYCLTHLSCCEYPFLEADDVMGILATSPDIEEDCIIVTIDKDLLQIPAPVYNIDTKELSQPLLRNPEMLFLEQVLVGDRVDNYPGCPGIGAKTVQKVFKGINDPDAMWGAIVKEYQKKGLTEKDALVQARCAYILQHENYDENGTITLWGMQYE